MRKSFPAASLSPSGPAALTPAGPQVPAGQSVRATLLKISGLIVGIIVVIAVLSLNFGIGLPSLLVAVGFYGGLLLWLGGKIIRFGVRRWRRVR